MTLDTVFFLASMTKAVTCVAAMQQVERGNIDLDEPIAGSSRSSAGPTSSRASTRRAPRSCARRADRSRSASSSPTPPGFAYDTWNGEIRRYMQQAGVPPVGSCKLAALQQPLASDPGTRWEYGIGIDWAGQVGRAAERPRPERSTSRRTSCEPLGMGDTGFCSAGPAGPQGRRAPADGRDVVRRRWTTRRTSSPSSSWAAAGSTRSAGTT